MKASMLFLERKDLMKLGKDQDAYTFHKLIYSLFPGDKREFLYLDKGGLYGTRSVLILSSKDPLQPDVGMIRTKIIPDFFLEQENYAFEVRLNPVRRKTGSSRMIPVKADKDLLNWFMERQSRWGINATSDSLRIDDKGIQVIQKGKSRIIHNQATFKGVLRVIDNKKFRQAFSTGLGRGKAFGFGLLQIQPIQ